MKPFCCILLLKLMLLGLPVLASESYPEIEWTDLIPADDLQVLMAPTTAAGPDC